MRCLNEKFNLFAMIIDLINLKNSEPRFFEFSLAPDEIDLQGETVKLDGDAKVAGEVKKGIAQTDVSGEIAARILLECSRCLAETKQNLKFPFEAAFITEENYTQAKEAELGAKDLDVSVFAGDKIDLTELAREQILLNLPEQVFCREDCQGLCEKCGANRNLISCNCEETKIDPRWQSLRELKIKNEK